MTFDQFGGLDHIVEQARKLIELPLERRAALEKIGAAPIKGVLLTGDPGMGKTLLARIIASRSGATYYEISGPEIFTKWVGDSERVLRAIFEDARAQPKAVIVFDELDSVASQRSDTANEVSRRVVAQLLTEMDGFASADGANVVVLATTNRAGDIDRALLRPGRFDWEITFPLPELADREAILKVQVVRRWNIQAAFKRLVDSQQKSLVVGSSRVTGNAPAVSSVEDLIQLIDTDAASPWVIADSSLPRGALLEVEIELEAKGVFQVATIVSTMMEFVRDLEKQLRGVDLSGLDEGAALGRIIDRLLVGLVPLRGEAVDWRWMRLRDKDWLVHRRVVEQLAPSIQTKAQPVAVAGVAEERLFWKDLRRVLFSRSRYLVMARLGKSGLQPRWTPVKLEDVFRSVFPDVDLDFQDLVRSLRAAFSQTEMSATGSTEQETMRRTLLLYASMLAKALDYDCSPGEFAAEGLLSNDQLDTQGDVEDELVAFQRVTGYLQRQTGEDVTPELAAQLREDARGAVALAIEEVAAPALDPPGPERYLDTEIVAIYW